MLYEIEFEYKEPSFGVIELSGDEETIREEAIQHIRMSYPEVDPDDIEITGLKRLED